MKKYSLIFSLLATIIAALFPTAASAIQYSGQRGLITWQKSGKFNALQYGDVDSITYSKVDLNGVTHPNVVVQVVWTPDSVYHIPIADIDTIAFKAPETVLNDSIFRIRDFHCQFVTDVTDLTITFNASIPADSLPQKGQVVITEKAYVEPFMHGFAGRVDTVITSGGFVRIICTEVTLKDIFKQILRFGKVETTSDESILTRMQNRAIDIVDEQGDTTIYFGTKTFDIIREGNSHISVDVTPKVHIDYTVYIGIGAKDIFEFDVKDTLECDLGFYWDKSIDTLITCYPFDPLTITIVPHIGLNAIFNLGGYVKLVGNAELGVRRHVTLSSRLGYLSDYPGRDQDHKGLLLEFDKPVWTDTEGFANFNLDELSAGLALKAGVCIIDEDLVSVNLTLNVGPKLSGNLTFSTNATSLYSEHLNDSITFTPLTASLTGGVNVLGYKKQWPLLKELPIAEWFPSLAPRTYYLFPKFTAPYLIEDTTLLTTDISRNLIFSVTPGIRITNQETGLTGLIYNKYSQDSYKVEPWNRQNLLMDLKKGYIPGSYTAKPIFTLFGKEIEATDTSTVTIPYSLSAPRSVTVRVGETDTIPFYGGWGTYTLNANDPTVCLTSLYGHSIIITGRKNGNTYLTLTDVRSNEEARIAVTVEGIPEITVEPDTLYFGNVPVGQSKTLPVTVKGYYLTGDLKVSNNHSCFSFDPATITKAQAESPNGATVMITYKPTAEINNATNITISGGGATAKKVHAKGTGVISTITVDPTTLNFDTVALGDTKVLPLIVSGTNLTSPITLGTTNHVFVFKDGNNYTQNCTIPASGGTVNVYYIPDSVCKNGGFIKINEQKKVNLKGVCVQPTITVDPDTLYFGNVPVGQSKTLPVTVKGYYLTGNLKVSNNHSCFSFTPSTISKSLAESPNGATVMITYKPTAEINNATNITISGGGATAKKVHAKGTGVVPEITTVPADTLAFGTVLLGDSISKTLTIKGTNLTGNLTVRTTNNTRFKVNHQKSITLTPDTNGAINKKVTVTYKPNQAQKNDGYVIISGGGIQQNDTVKLSGVCEEAYITVTPTTLDFGSSLTPGVTYSQEFTLETNVPGTLRYSLDATYPSVFTVPTIKAGNNTVKFGSNEAGTYSGVINIQDEKGRATASVNLNATVVPQISVNPTRHDFGTVVKGYTATKTFNVTTKGFISEMRVEMASNNSKFTLNKSTLGASGGEFIVTYKPTAPGTDTATVTISSVGPGGQVSKTIKLSGKCVNGYITVTPTTLNFGSNLVPDETYSQKFTLETNVPGTLSYSIDTPYPSVFTIEAGNNTVKFCSKEAGTYSGRIIIKDEISGATTTVNMNATVVPQITVNPTTHNFGTVVTGNTATKTFNVSTLGFTGAMYLEMASNSSKFTLNKSTLNANSGSFDVTYRPTAAGTDTATVTISSVGPGGQVSTTIKLRGKCVVPTITVNPTSLTFSKVTINTISDAQTFKVTGNNLNGPLTITPPNNFRVSPTQISAEEAANGKTVEVQFMAPAQPGTYSGNITISDGNGGATDKSVAVTGTAIRESEYDP